MRFVAARLPAPTGARPAAHSSFVHSSFAQEPQCATGVPPVIQTPTGGTPVAYSGAPRHRLLPMRVPLRTATEVAAPGVWVPAAPTAFPITHNQ